MKKLVFLILKNNRQNCITYQWWFHIIMVKIWKVRLDIRHTEVSLTVVIQTDLENKTVQSCVFAKNNPAFVGPFIAFSFKLIEARAPIQ